MIWENIQENKENLRKLFHNTSDLALYEFETLSGDRAFIAYIIGIIDEASLNENLLKPLIKDLISPLEIKSTVYVTGTTITRDLKELILPINSGNVALFIEGLDHVYVFNLEEWIKRPVEKPVTESTIKGPSESFVEDIIVNKTLIRRKIKNNNLVFEDHILGRQTNTTISIVYLEGIVEPEVLKEVKERIGKIEIDGILDISYVKDYIEDKPRTLICTTGNTERPDVVVSKILEGRVAILCDGSPNAITVPKVFIENLNFPDDYYQRPRFSTFVRIIRYISYFTSFLLPGVYMALILFHQEMIPTRLLISIAGQREGAPLAAPIEALGVIIFFEILKESSIRLPEQIGQAVTLVGGLVIGQAAVEAGFISASLVIVIAAAGMAEFVVPNIREMVSVYRIGFLLLGSIAGLYGITAGLIVMASHLVSLESFGVPYMWPIAPYNKEGMRDFIIKYPLKKMNLRPQAIAKEGSRKRNEKEE